VVACLHITARPIPTIKPINPCQKASWSFLEAANRLLSKQDWPLTLIQLF